MQILDSAYLSGSVYSFIHIWIMILATYTLLPPAPPPLPPAAIAVQT
jgi:hypothetical protein